MKKLVFFIFLIANLWSYNCAVIAPSISTQNESYRVMRKLQCSFSSFRDSDFILVVVRSELFDPLMLSYESVSELKRDSDMQLNISGSNFHIYIYGLNGDLSVNQLKHISYKAND